MTLDAAKSSSAHLAELERRLHDLEIGLGGLSDRVGALERGRGSFTIEPEPPRPSGAAAAPDSAAWTWIAQSRGLTRVATVSFALVVSLVLRTLTESGALAPRLGVALGIAYTGMLVVLGWYSLAGNRFGQRVFPACGTLLLCLLLLETHSRMQFPSAPAANALLLAMLAAIAWLGTRYRAPAIVEIAALAVAVTSVALGFPHPVYPLTAALLVLANAAALRVSPLRRHPWLHWVVLALTLLFWLMWAVQVAAARRHPEAGLATLPSWFLPALAATCASHLAIAIWPRHAPMEALPFRLFLAPANVASGLVLAALAVPAGPGGRRWLGAAALGVAAAHLLLASAARRREGWRELASPALVVAATAAFVPGTAWVLGDLRWALPLWAGAALVLLSASFRSGSAALRLLAHGLQAGTCSFGVLTGQLSVPAHDPAVAALVGLVLAAAAGLHYRWSRRTEPPAASWYARLAPGDRPAIVLLWIGLWAAFLASRMALYELLARLEPVPDAAFSGAQSVLVNLMSIAVMAWGVRQRSKEKLGTGVLVAGLGGLKVFASDLLTIQGIPLVASVFSFGLATAAGSVLLGRWQRLPHLPHLEGEAQGGRDPRPAEQGTERA